MKKRCQFSMEFIMIFALVLFLFAVLLAVLVRLTDDKQEEAVQGKFEVAADSLQGSLMLATGAAEFEADITVPDKIEDLDYEVRIINKNTLMLNHSKYIVFRDIPDTQGSLVKGCNRITKSAGVISVAGC